MKNRNAMNEMNEMNAMNQAAVAGALTPPMPRRVHGNMIANALYRAIWGVCVGDALGLPVQFLTREEVRENPVTDMIGYGTFGVPAGSWSDDSSLTLCLAYSLGETGRVDYQDIAARFVDWRYNGAYTPFGYAYDIGGSCNSAVWRMKQGRDPLTCGDTGKEHNGNGSLMRIMPLLFWLYPRYGADLTASDEAMETIHRVSGLTHAHPIAKSACGIYLNVAARVMEAPYGGAKDLQQAVTEGITAALAYYRRKPEFKNHLHCWRRLENPAALAALPDREIRSSGYVVDTLEAAIYCLLNGENYEQSVLKAVNLGYDTDSVGAVTGGLAGLAYFTSDSVPKRWKDALQARELIEKAMYALQKICAFYPYNEMTADEAE